MTDTEKPDEVRLMQIRVTRFDGGTYVVEQTPMAEVLWERHFNLPIGQCNPKLATWRVEYSYYLVWCCTDRKIDFDTWIDDIKDVRPIKPDTADDAEQAADDADPLAPTPELGS